MVVMPFFLHFFIASQIYKSKSYLPNKIFATYQYCIKFSKNIFKQLIIKYVKFYF